MWKWLTSDRILSGLSLLSALRILNKILNFIYKVLIELWYNNQKKGGIMSVHFQSYPYSEVAAILPQYKKEVIDAKISALKANLGELNINEGKEVKNLYPLLIASGAIIAIAGIFLTLAAHQILPHGINAISRLGIGGQILSYCVIGSSALIVMIGSVKFHLVRKENSKLEIYRKDLERAHYSAEVAEMDSYFPCRLDANEFFVVDNASRSEITIYYCMRIQDKIFPRSFFEVVAYTNSSSDAAFNEWYERNQHFVAWASCIDLQTLRDRTENFENEKEQEI
jgi:hypothetical protein